MNGYVLFAIGCVCAIVFFLVVGYGVAKMTEWEMRKFREGFIEREGREPRADEYPDPEPYGPSLT